ncbi:hypothetical protein LCGC14_2758370 [marine sediment metagenome]|uniref:Uncharacterized protein n=1 Tax=marine sediment metagenome TaxID=412755 RepID=A0A0F9B8C0_9ZZZZ
MKIKITEIHKDDSYHIWRDRIIGQVVEVTGSLRPFPKNDLNYTGFSGVSVKYLEKPKGLPSTSYFLAIKYEEVKEDED